MTVDMEVVVVVVYTFLICLRKLASKDDVLAVKLCCTI